MVLEGKSTWRKVQEHREKAVENQPQPHSAGPQCMVGLLEQLRADEQGTPRRRAHAPVYRRCDQGLPPHRRARRSGDQRCAHLPHPDP